MKIKNIYVVIEWSENSRIDSLKERLTFEKANTILANQHERNISANMQGYEKTKFRMIIETKEKELVYVGRFDLGCVGEWNSGTRDLYTYLKNDLKCIENEISYHKEAIKFLKDEVLPFCKELMR